MKYIYLTAYLCLFFWGCKSNTTSQIDQKTERMMKGDWTILSVNYSGSDVIKMNSFQIAEAHCMVGSNWNFVSNNNQGQMALRKADCPVFESKITWFVNKEGNFVFKILNGAKGKSVNEGFVLRIENLSERSFQLVDKVNIGGKITEVFYQFNKN